MEARRARVRACDARCVPNHSVCGFVALAILLAAGSSNATDYHLKPPLHGPPLLDVQSPRIRGAVEKCSELATSRRVFGDVTVTIDDLTNPKVSGSPMLGPYRDVIERCVRNAFGNLLRQLEREGDPAGKAVDRWPVPFAWTLGQALPLLPPLEILLPRWEAAIAAPRREGGAPATLAAVLPPGVSLRSDGCLGISLHGPAVAAALDLWALRSGRALHEMWFSLAFFDRLAPHRPSGVLVLSDSRLLIASAGQPGESLCLRPLEPQEVQTIRSQIERIGTCWEGGFEERLRAPRVGFPADRVFESVSTNGLTTCALDREGAMSCCGATLGLGESAADLRWRSISLRRVGFCGVSKRGELSCVGNYAPLLQHQKTVSQGIGPVCSIDERARPTCYQRSTRPGKAPPSRLDRGVRLRCGTREDGAEECDTLSEILPTGGSWPPVDRISASEHGICGVSKDHHVVCSSAGPPVNRDVDFRDVATAPLTDAACALKSDGNLACWSLRDGARLAFSPAGPFAALSPVLDADVVCGIGNDRKILCARRTPASGAGVDLPVPPPDDFKAVTAAGRQYCGLTTAGRVRCWGTTWPGPNRWAEEGRVAN